MQIICTSLQTDNHASTSPFILQQRHPFNSPMSGTTRVSRYQKGKTNLDLLAQEIVYGSGISWAICKSAPRPRPNNHAITPPLSFLQAGCPSATQPTASKHLLARIMTTIQYRCRTEPCVCRRGCRCMPCRACTGENLQYRSTAEPAPESTRSWVVPTRVTNNPHHVKPPCTCNITMYLTSSGQNELPLLPVSASTSAFSPST